MCIRDSAYTGRNTTTKTFTGVTRASRGTTAAAHSDDDAVTWVPVSYTHLRAHETVLDLVCRLLLEKKKNTQENDEASQRSSPHST